MMLRLLLQDALQPLRDELRDVKEELHRQRETYYDKEYLDQRFKPLEQAAITKNQRIGMLVSAGLGAISVLINLLSHLQLR